MMGQQKREPRRGMVIEGLVLALLIAVSVAPQADELASNLDEADGGIAKVWSVQHHAQTFTTGGRESGYLVESIELDVVAWTEDADVTVSVHAAWSSGGPGDHLYTLENPTRGTGRKVFSVRKRDRVRLVERQPHAIVIRNTGGKGSFNLNTTPSINPADESDWRIENARWTTNPTDDLDRWIGATGAIKMRVNDRDAPPLLSVAGSRGNAENGSLGRMYRVTEGKGQLTVSGVGTSVAMLGEGWPLTLRGTIATETGLDLVMVPLKGRGEPVSAVAPHGFALAVDTSIPPHFTGNQMGAQQLFV